MTVKHSEHRPNTRRRARPTRPGLAVTMTASVLTLGAIAAWLWRVIADIAGDLLRPARTSGQRPDDLLVLACAAVALVIAVRWLVGLILTGLTLLPGAIGVIARRGQRALAPAVLIRLTSAVLGGTALTVLPSTGATAVPSPQPVGVTTPARPVVSTPSGGAAHAEPAPARPLPDPGWGTARSSPGRAAPATKDPAPAPSPARGTVRVAAGDTLWDLAADRLPPGSDAARIDRAWRAWYAANRRVVGPDPDLIRPGQRLVPPPRSVAPSQPTRLVPGAHPQSPLEESR